MGTTDIDFEFALFSVDRVVERLPLPISRRHHVCIFCVRLDDLGFLAACSRASFPEFVPRKTPKMKIFCLFTSENIPRSRFQFQRRAQKSTTVCRTYALQRRKREEEAFVLLSFDDGAACRVLSSFIGPHCPLLGTYDWKKTSLHSTVVIGPTVADASFYDYDDSRASHPTTSHYGFLIQRLLPSPSGDEGVQDGGKRLCSRYWTSLGLAGDWRTLQGGVNRKIVVRWGVPSEVYIAQEEEERGGCVPELHAISWRSQALLGNRKNRVLVDLFPPTGILCSAYILPSMPRAMRTEAAVCPYSALAIDYREVHVTIFY
jgi:hypothetical protein